MQSATEQNQTDKRNNACEKNNQSYKYIHALLLSGLVKKEAALCCGRF